MSEPTLFDFVDVLADAGLLRRVSVDVAGRFELAECVRQLRSGNRETPAVIFDRVVDQALPVLASTYGSAEAIALAFGVDTADDLPAKIGEWLRPRGGRGVRDVLAMLPALTRSLSWGDSGGQARCQQVVRLGRDVDLGQLPIPHCWPAESGPTLTGGLLITRDTEGGQTVSPCIAEVVDSTTLRVRFADGSVELDAWNGARTTGRQLDVSLAFGGPPSLWPTVWLSEVLGIDANVLGEVFGRPQPATVRGRTVAATVPAASELVIEGRVDPDSPPAEPARVTSDWGRVSASGTWATVSVHAITHAAAAVVPTVIRHSQPHDLSALNTVAERCLEQLVCALVPGVVALRTPSWGAERQCVLLAIGAGHVARAGEIAAAVRGLHSLSKSKAVVLLDEAVDLENQEAVLSAIIECSAPRRDIRIVDTSWNADDPSGGEVGSAVIIDATMTVQSSTHRKARPSPSVAKAVRAMLAQQ